MSVQKNCIALLFGGKSAEHEVSVQSANNVYQAINKKKYDVLLIAIDRDGKWYLSDAAHLNAHAADPKSSNLHPGIHPLAICPGLTENKLIDVKQNKTLGKIDIVFPILHGPFGEDGTVQGLLKLSELPFIGASVLGSAAGMDKDVTKRLLRDADIPQAKFLVYRQGEKEQIFYDNIVRNLGSPVFVKPANLGSSVGIQKVHNAAEFKFGIEEAFRFDTKIVIEEQIRGREIECSVLGNENPVASEPGEIIAQRSFYDYKAKYLDENGALLQIPARLEQHQTEQIKELAVKTFKVLCCEGFGRVDFFLDENNKIYVNEINTIPGFTQISMYPRLWEASGISYPELIDRLIQLAIERYGREKELSYTL